MTDMYIKEENTLSKNECEFLLGVLLPIAEKQIRKYGEFYPFGAVLLNNDTVELLNICDENTSLDSQQAIDSLVKTYKQLASEGKIKASGIAWRAAMKNSSGENDEAIIVSLEHKNNYSVVVGEKYRVGIFKKGIFRRVKFDDLCAFEGKHDVF